MSGSNSPQYAADDDWDTEPAYLIMKPDKFFHRKTIDSKGVALSGVAKGSFLPACGRDRKRARTAGVVSN
jgi:hypothetical protein